MTVPSTAITAAQNPDERARSEGGSERAGDEGRECNAQVAGRLVQTQREPTAPRADEIDLHHDGHRPGESLVGAEEEVRNDDPAPAGRERDQERHGQSKQPADDEEALTPDAVGEPAGGEVRERLGDPEGDDEAEDRALRGEVEVALADEREHAPLEPDHRADEGVQADKKRELTGVLAKPEPGRRRAHVRVATTPRRFASTISRWFAGAGGRSTSSASAKLAASGCASAELWRRSKPMLEKGLPERPRPQTEPP